MATTRIVNTEPNTFANISPQSYTVEIKDGERWKSIAFFPSLSAAVDFATWASKEKKELVFENGTYVTRY